MNKEYFKIELLDDVILSQKTATVGNHKSLDFIPGSALLGVAASRFYQDKLDKAWNVFHSSKVRFCNAYPLIDEKRAFPTPLSLHTKKEPAAEKKNAAEQENAPEKQGSTGEISNFVKAEAEEGIQYRQMRSGYINIVNNSDNSGAPETLHIVLPALTSRMRTAIDIETGTAAKSQLYDYESLDAGQIFIGKIEWDDTDESIKSAVEIIRNFFCSEEGNIIRLGRSKTASYGRAKISNFTYSEENCSEIKCEKQNSFSILAVSDLCLRNSITGTPKLEVSLEDIGLNKSSSDNSSGTCWTLDKEHSFMRPSFIYQYNAYRKELEIQKTLISKGSVFTFKSTLDTGLSPEEKKKVIEAINNGIGEAKNQGFGEIALFDIGGTFNKEEVECKLNFGCNESDKNHNNSKAEQLSDYDKSWLEWLKPVVNADVHKIVNESLEKFVETYESIKIFQLSNYDRILPGKNQWDNILDVIKNTGTKNEIIQRLFTNENAVIKTDMENALHPEWNYVDESGKCLQKWLENFINKDCLSLGDSDTRIALQELVKRCKDKVSEVLN